MQVGGHGRSCAEQSKERLRAWERYSTAFEYSTVANADTKQAGQPLPHEVLQGAIEETSLTEWAVVRLEAYSVFRSVSRERNVGRSVLM